MKVNIETLRAKCKEIEELIWTECVDPSGKEEPIIDGIVDIDTYYNEPLRILWILKEPYDEDGGGWSFPKAFKEKTSEFSKSPTFQPIIYVSYGILNNFLLWDDMEDIQKSPDMANVLFRIAYINIKKMPGGSRTSVEVLDEAYGRYKPILLKQIEAYEPNVIVGGNTLDFFKDDLKFKTLNKVTLESLVAYSNSEAIYLDAYHPAQSQIKREVYVDEMVTAVKNWWNKRKKAGPL